MKCVTMSSSGTEKFARLLTVQAGQRPAPTQQKMGLLPPQLDDEVHVQPLLQERGEAVATVARLRACSWLAGSLVLGTTEVDAGGCSVSLGQRQTHH